MVTIKQLELIKGLNDWTEKKGHSPTVKELAQEMNTNKEDVMACIESLEKLGCIRKQYSLARPMIVTDQGKEIIKRKG